MTDEKLFHFLISRVHAREAVSLTLATITSSASLILLALFFTIKQDIPILAVILGILFPSIAFTYIENTYRRIHRHDHEWIRRLIAEEHQYNKESRDREETEKYYFFQKIDSSKEFFLDLFTYCLFLDGFLFWIIF